MYKITIEVENKALDTVLAFIGPHHPIFIQCFDRPETYKTAPMNGSYVITKSEPTITIPPELRSRATVRKRAASANPTPMEKSKIAQYIVNHTTVGRTYSPQQIQAIFAKSGFNPESWNSAVSIAARHGFFLHINKHKTNVRYKRINDSLQLPA